MSKNLSIVCETLKLTPKAVETYDALILGVAEKQIDEAANKLPGKWADVVRALAKSDGFSGKMKQQLVLRLPRDTTQKKFIVVTLVGLGAPIDFRAADAVRLGGQMTRLANAQRAKRLWLCVPDAVTEDDHLAMAMGQGLYLGNYRYTEYLSATGPKAEQKKDAPLGHITVASSQPQTLKRAFGCGRILAEHVALARDLVNRPANDLYPESFAKLVASRAKQAKLGCRILGARELEARKMGLLIGVGQGSPRKPRLVHLTYKGGGRHKPIALVGKGITFDSGGLCIKPGESMATMKMDMGGAAAVFSTLLCAQALKLPGEIHAVLALAENMPSGDAIRPGDILTSAKGITVEVNNTDAEGRLVLADALDYIQKEVSPTHIIDVATLTGACMVALGPKTVGLFSNQDPFADHILSAAGHAGEDLWRLPLTAALEDQLRSDCADMRNTGERYGGAITAALFLQRFIDKGRAWSHLDIAGPAFGSEDAAHLRKGGTGVATATLVKWLMTRTQSTVGTPGQ